MSDFKPIRILGIIEASVTKPRSDGTRGSALYKVPFRLSRRPPEEWAECFARSLDHPSSWTSAHRPGICHVVGDTVWLNGTTLDEIEKMHKATLLLVLEDTNSCCAEFAAKKAAEEEKRPEEEEGRQLGISRQARRITFD